MRPKADQRRVELALDQFPYREMLAREYAARFAQATSHYHFQEFVGLRYADATLEAWIDEFTHLLESPSDLAACRQEFLGTTAVEYRLFCLDGCIQRAEVVRLSVASGQLVAVDQPFMEVETSKMVMEFHCPQAGVATPIVAEGDEIHEGDVLLRIESSDPWPVPSPVWHRWWEYTCGSVASESWSRRSTLIAEAEARRKKRRT